MITLKETKKNQYELDKDKYLLKKGSNYRIIYPIRDSEGNINWKNLLIGGKRSNLFATLFVLSLIIYLSWGYAEDTKSCRELFQDPIKACALCSRLGGNYQQPQYPYFNDEFNLSLLT